MVRQKPKAGEVYRHFKGKEYLVLHLAQHTETGEEMVVYEALYDDHSIFVRPLSMFLSQVDHNKYPDAKQRYRFELQKSEDAEDTMQKLIFDFLDQEKNEEKMEFLQAHRNHLSDRFLSVVAESLDFVENETDIDQRYLSIMNYLNTLIKYESGRLR